MRPGDKIICINADFSKCWDNPRKYFDRLPEEGKVYVIDEFIINKNGEPGFTLLGINSIERGRYTFFCWRFRLLEEMKKENAQKTLQKLTLNEALALVLILEKGRGKT